MLWQKRKILIENKVLYKALIYHHRYPDPQQLF
jgi:hypothetical protein